jgi:hypothetical protein
MRRRPAPSTLDLFWRARSLQESPVLTNVIARIIGLRREYEQCGVDAVLPLFAPNHRREVDTDAGFVQQDFQARRSVIDGDAALAIRANQKLMTPFVRVLSTDLIGRNAGNDKISLRKKRIFTLELSDGEVATRIPDPGKLIDINSSHPCGRFKNFRFTGPGLYFDRFLLWHSQHTRHHSGKNIVLANGSSPLSTKVILISTPS